MLVGIIGWIVLGLIVGFVASKIASRAGDDPRLGIAVGAVGGVIGGWLYSGASGEPVTALGVWGLLFAAIGAAAAAGIWHVVRSRAAPVLYQNRRYR